MPGADAGVTEDGRGARGRPPSGRPLPRIVAQVRGTEEWGRWLAELARARGTDKSDLIEDALRHFASHLRLPPPPHRKGGI